MACGEGHPIPVRRDQPREHQDPRVAAVVAAVPTAADFDMSSLAMPRVPLVLVLAEKDLWLAPHFHGAAVRSACQNCEVIADMPGARHGSMLSPLPPDVGGSAGDLLNDPPGFDRGCMPRSIAGLQPSSCATCRPSARLLRKHRWPTSRTEDPQASLTRRPIRIVARLHSEYLSIDPHAQCAMASCPCMFRGAGWWGCGVAGLAAHSAAAADRQF